MSFVVLWKLCALVVLIGKKYFVMISFSLYQFFCDFTLIRHPFAFFFFTDA